MKIKYLIILICSVFANLTIYCQEDIYINNSSELNNEVINDTALILLEPTTNYVIKLSVQKKIKKGKCDCLESFKKCYLYLIKIDSVLFKENNLVFNEKALNKVSFMTSKYPYLNSNQIILGLFRDSGSKKYIILETIIPTKGSRPFKFEKEEISIAGPIECMGQKIPFSSFFNRKKVKEKYLNNMPPKDLEN